MGPVGRSFNSYDPLNEKPPDGSSTSFWGSPKGKILIGVIIALVVIGAVVGGAVGGTVGKKNTSKLVQTSATGTEAQAAGGSMTTASATAPFSSADGGLPSISFAVTPTATASGVDTRPFSFIAPTQSIDKAIGELGNQAMGSNPVSNLD